MFPALLLPGSRQSVAPRLSAAFAPRTRGAGISSQPCSTSASARRDSSQDSTCRFGFGQCAVKVLGRAQGAFRQHQARRLLYCSPQGLGCRTSGAGARERRPNESFKPMPHRGANHMAGTACHALHAPLRHGLTLVLGLVSRTVVARFQAICSASLIRSVCTSHARCRHRQSVGKHFGFGQARLSARFDLPHRLRPGCGESSGPRRLQHHRFGLADSSLGLTGQTCCNVRLRGWVTAGQAQVLGSGGLTSRSSRIRFVPQNTWQVQLAMCFAALRCSA